jgi:catechol 2,3-dioxygenase-like lactoylglutathione lyase family enzyme
VTTEIQKNAIDIGIITNHLEAMLSFYSETLGLELEAVIDMPGGGVMNRFTVGDSIVKVIGIDPPTKRGGSTGWHPCCHRLSLLDDTR